MKRENIGKKLKSIRISKDFSCETIANILGLELNNYLEIEYGNRDVTVEELIKLSKLYKTKVHNILFKNPISN